MLKKIDKILKKKDKSKIVSLTAYSTSIAKILDKYCDITLVGDSMANVLYGMKNTHKINLNTITRIIAILIIFAAVINCFGFKINNNINKKHERIITSFIGFGSGILGGLSTVYGPPMLAYLVAVDLPKENFVRTVSTMYFIGSFPLYGSLIYYGFATKQDLIMSLLLIIPALIGQQIGTKIRDKINQKQFRNCILVTLVILGIMLFAKTI